jgi:magnesium transporter
MSPFSPIRPRLPIRVVLSSTALLSYTSLWKGAALAIAELGVAAFFLSGLTASLLGGSSAWFVLGAALLATFVRAIDIEAWGLLIPGGLTGAVKHSFGARVANVASASTLVERLLLAALAAVVVAHYIVGVAITTFAGRQLTGFVRPEDLATIVAVFVIGLLWLQVRLGRHVAADAIAKGIWAGIAILVVFSAWGVVSLIAGDRSDAGPLLALPVSTRFTGRGMLDTVLLAALGVALTLPALGSGEAFARSAHEFAPPRIQVLRRLRRLTILFGLVVTTMSAFLFVVLIPETERSIWAELPLAGIVEHMAGSERLRDLGAFALVCAAVLMLVPTAQAALGDLEHMVQRWSIEGLLPGGLAALHTRFGTPARAVDISVASTVLAIVVGGGRVTWLARAYAIAVAVMLVLRVAVLVRNRRAPAVERPYTAPLNLNLGRGTWPVGLIAAAAIVGTSGLVAVAVGDGPSIAASLLIVALTAWFALVNRQPVPASGEGDETFDLLPSAEVSFEPVDARAGNVLVPVRNPHALGHVVAALRAAGDRDVVIMTVRLLGIDVTDENGSERGPTAYERRLLSDVVALTERYGRPVRLLIVPARSVVDAIVATVLRLRSSEVYVGESASLSAADQARLLGESWERADKHEGLDVRLVIHHRSGRSDLYHLGAHPPALSPSDLDLIHQLWLDAVKSVGPHVHHHDIVRAALTQMDQQLSGPQRGQALDAIRDVARPAEELAGALRAADYTRLRDMMRNRHASDVAGLLTSLTLEDQAVFFRVLPRKDAAAVFEYLSQESKEALLKAMAQEDVAALINNMAPDDRTLFLEELPAEVTRQLLALLSPGERAVAVTLLGYPEKSVGRLMTPHYLSIREEWSVREVLDYVREHGQDSETLNVAYVVDDGGQLIDDVRIREFLLAPLDKRVADLMDRRFVALKATDNQEDAVAAFRQYDRSALPVTDTAGMLIGIVTVDDMLDVAEATATREIQKIGGSEALDEPYISIPFWRMVQKRAGWLTALFLGEMLTATAMGAFEAEISKAVVLALFVPLIISSGGNSGSQAATLVIRALALGEVGLRDWWRVMRREVMAGLALGAILGTIGFLRITVWSAFSDIYGPHWLLVAATVAIALVGVVLWGSLSGSLLPFLLKKLGFDPAASSAPFVATLVDVTGLVIYFSVALVILQGTLL